MSHPWNNGGRVLYSPLSVKYKGLVNQGATCYLNSVLQVLFMTEDFREAVERYPGTEDIDLQLKSLFNKLKNQTANTVQITDKLRIKKVYKQRDAAEYYEKILNLTSDEASQIFHGELTHRTTCLNCETQTDANERFWHLPLTLVNSSSEYKVKDGVDDYFRASVFRGENQMYCDQCDDKHDATTRCVVKHHPEVLMLLLKRFEFNYNFMTYTKMNHNVSFPHKLKIPENQLYELYAVVNHVGDLRSGHYTSTIKSSEDGRWYKFNDRSVKRLDYQPFQTENSERSNSAYLLFYRKIKETCTPEDTREEFVPGHHLPSTRDLTDQQQDTVMVEEKEVAEESKAFEMVGSAEDEDRVGVRFVREAQPPEPCYSAADQENEVMVMDKKKDKDGQMDRDKLRDRKGKGRHQEGDGLAVGKVVRRDPDVRWEDGKGTSSSRGEGRIIRDFKVYPEGKTGANEQKTKSKKHVTRTDPGDGMNCGDLRFDKSRQSEGKDDQTYKQRSSYRHSMNDQQKEMTMDVHRAGNRKYYMSLYRESSSTKPGEDTVKRHSDDTDHERADTRPKSVQAAGEQEKKGDLKVYQNRREARSSKETKGQGEVRKRGMRAEFDESIVEEKQSPKKTDAGVEEKNEEEISNWKDVELPTQKETSRNKRQSFERIKKYIFSKMETKSNTGAEPKIGLRSKIKANKVNHKVQEDESSHLKMKRVNTGADTGEQAAAVKYEGETGHSEDGKKKGKSLSCILCFIPDDGN